jgi:ATP-dependent exoDNAse (exonuclease V) alpha subunit
MCDHTVQLNEQQQFALQAAIDGSTVISGSAGTGKSFLVCRLIKELEKRGFEVGVCAPTWTAALKIGGTSMHRTFGLRGCDLNRQSEESVVDALEEMDYVVIDEFSMMDMKLFIFVDNVLKKHYGNSLLFGGKKVILCGDAKQLPPIRPDSMLLDYPEYIRYFKIIKLTVNIRQGNDRLYATICNQVANRCVDSETERRLGTRYVDAQTSKQIGPDVPRLCPRRAEAACINSDQYAKLQGSGKRYMNDVVATHEGGDNQEMYRIATKLFENTIPAEISLKNGAYVMLTANVKPEKGLYNGQTGKVVECNERSVCIYTGDDAVYEEAPEDNRLKYLKTKDCANIHYIPTNTKIYQYTNKDTSFNIVGVPLVLSWAITIHKSQGATLAKAVINLAGSFNNEQIYVALSRVESLEGLYLTGLPETWNEQSEHHDKCVEFEQLGVEHWLPGAKATYILCEYTPEKNDEWIADVNNAKPPSVVHCMDCPEDDDTAVDMDEWTEPPETYRAEAIKTELAGVKLYCQCTEQKSSCPAHALRRYYISLYPFLAEFY